MPSRERNVMTKYKKQQQLTFSFLFVLNPPHPPSPPSSRLFIGDKINTFSRSSGDIGVLTIYFSLHIFFCLLLLLLIFVCPFCLTIPNITIGCIYCCCCITVIICMLVVAILRC
eukprot:PhM_4_TR2395/c0_g1_i3/m.104359